MSIYSISNWAAGTYVLNDIVRYPSNSSIYYYSLTDANTDTPPSAKWGGVSSINGVTKPSFIWKPNYSVTAKHQPKTTQIGFGDGYLQRVVQNINNDLLELELSFELRKEKESQAINHFLYARKAQESFLFTPSSPHDLQKLFICLSWTDTYVFYGNHLIRAMFQEVPV